MGVISRVPGRGARKPAETGLSVTTSVRQRGLQLAPPTRPRWPEGFDLSGRCPDSVFRQELPQLAFQSFGDALGVLRSVAQGQVHPTDDRPANRLAVDRVTRDSRCRLQ